MTKQTTTYKLDLPPASACDKHGLTEIFRSTEEDKKKRLGTAADQIHRIKYKKFKK